MKVCVLAGLSLLVGTSFVQAQVDWQALGQKLGDHIKADQQAAKLFAPIQKSADEALNDKPNPIELIRTEGLLSGDPKKTRSWASVADIGKINALAWSAIVTGDERYQKQALVFLRAWADVNHSKNDPIDDTNIGPAIVAYSMLKTKATDADRKAIDKWLRETADTAMHGKQQKNNWQNHRIKIVGLIGAALPYPEAAAFAKKAWQVQLDSELLPDGSTSDFYERDAMHYHLYSLEPLLYLAANTGQTGEDLYKLTSPQGASLKKCVAFVEPFATGEKQHIEFVHSTVAFDRKRAANGEKEYIPHPWTPKASLAMFTVASLFNPQFDELVKKLSGASEAKYASWDAYVINVRRSLALAAQ